ncbi:tail fiber assembly protein [Photorhabdus antumapuensis]|uniref:tail fiber assembly protein n=1 Tax=Photorhabdus antumapuensis TaxID=2862867 RepID=UPI00295F0FD4|nr:tail fiber assembly protein [Photorhabdus antumapuensis]MCA6222910.1 tail fiber assembly protein [Photorhabdus antumapuensis]
MINIKNFTPYTPMDIYGKSDNSVMYLRSEQGEDWYECQCKFSINTIKIQYDNNGIITSYSSDVSSLFPFNMSVTEVEYVPVDIDINGHWVFDGVSIIKRIYSKKELVMQVRNQKTILLIEAANKISPLQDAVDLNIATDEEKTALLAWKKYRVILNRIDTSLVPNVEWPELPK